MKIYNLSMPSIIFQGIFLVFGGVTGFGFVFFAGTPLIFHGVFRSDFFGDCLFLGSDLGIVLYG